MRVSFYKLNYFFLVMIEYTLLVSHWCWSFLPHILAVMWKQVVKAPSMDGLVKKPDLLSFHIASKIPVSESTRQELLEIDGTSYRLRREIELLECCDHVRCKMCQVWLVFFHKHNIFWWHLTTLWVTCFLCYFSLAGFNWKAKWYVGDVHKWSTWCVCESSRLCAWGNDIA